MSPTSQTRRRVNDLGGIRFYLATGHPRFCKPLVAGSNPAPGTNKIVSFPAFPDRSVVAQVAHEARTLRSSAVTRVGTARSLSVLGAAMMLHLQRGFADNRQDQAMAGRNGKRSTSFKPGQSGNPHGRPKVAGEVQELARCVSECAGLHQGIRL